MVDAAETRKWRKMADAEGTFDAVETADAEETVDTEKTVDAAETAGCRGSGGNG